MKDPNVPDQKLMSRALEAEDLRLERDVARRKLGLYADAVRQFLEESRKSMSLLTLMNLYVRKSYKALLDLDQDDRRDNASPPDL